MTDLAITAASVVAGGNASTVLRTAGETVAAGKVVYKSPTTSKSMLADNDSATAGAKVPEGIALNGASLDQPLVVQRSGLVTIGATLTPGVSYYLSNTAGGICPFADVGSGEDVVLIGVAVSASQLDLDIRITGVTN